MVVIVGLAPTTSPSSGARSTSIELNHRKLKRPVGSPGLVYFLLKRYEILEIINNPHVTYAVRIMAVAVIKP